jgi:hypothetical protein
VPYHGPGRHERDEVLREALPPRVPERLREDLVVLDGDGAHLAPQVKRASLEHDAVLVVHASTLTVALQVLFESFSSFSPHHIG